MSRKATNHMLAKILASTQVPMSIGLEMGKKTVNVEIDIEELKAVRDELRLFGYLDAEGIAQALERDYTTGAQ